MADPPHVSLRWGDAEPRHEPLVRRSNPVIMESIRNLSTGLEARGTVSQGREGLTPYVLQENEGLGIKRTRSIKTLRVRAREPGSVQINRTCNDGCMTGVWEFAMTCSEISAVRTYRADFPDKSLLAFVQGSPLHSSRTGVPRIVNHPHLDAYDYEVLLQRELISNGVDEVVREHSFIQGTSRADFFDSVFRKSRGFLYGGMYNEVSPSEEKTEKKTERQNGWLANLNRPTDKEKDTRQKFFANLGSLENLKDFMVNTKRVFHFITSSESTSTSVEFSNLSVSEEFRLSILNAMSSQNWEKVESLIMPIAVALPVRAAVYRAVVILAALLLSVVYQYLIGLLHRGGGNIHSSGSLEFRSTYISIVLFQGAYVWIKSRDVAPESLDKPSPGLYRKSKVNEWGERIYYGNYEPRFKPCDSIDSYISVGSYEKEEEAKTMYQILAFFYGKREGKLRLVDGGTYPIPPMTVEEQLLFGSENYPLPPMSEEVKILFDKQKREFVKGKAKAAFTDYKQVMDSIVSGWMQNPEIQPTRDIFNTVRPRLDCADASAGSGQMEGGIQSAEEGYPGNQGRDALVSVSSGDCHPDVGPVTQGMQHMANDRLGEHVVGGAGQFTVPQSRMRSLPEAATNIPANGTAVPCEQPRELQLQHGSLQENQANNSANNIIPDDLSQVQRQVIELQRKVNELHRQRKESERQRQLDQLQIRQQQSQISESEFRISELERQQKLQQLRTQQQESRFSELESRFSEFEGTVLEHSRKRPLRSHSET